jgi:hypothetical protein
MSIWDNEENLTSGGFASSAKAARHGWREMLENRADEAGRGTWILFESTRRSS